MSKALPVAKAVLGPWPGLSPIYLKDTQRALRSGSVHGTRHSASFSNRVQADVYADR
jgi:hypothetical protein